jgi:hypothetical protein
MQDEGHSTHAQKWMESMILTYRLSDSGVKDVCIAWRITSWYFRSLPLADAVTRSTLGKKPL